MRITIDPKCNKTQKKMPRRRSPDGQMARCFFDARVHARPPPQVRDSGRAWIGAEPVPIGLPGLAAAQSNLCCARTRACLLPLLRLPLSRSCSLSGKLPPSSPLLALAFTLTTLTSAQLSIGGFFRYSKVGASNTASSNVGDSGKPAQCS